MTVNDLIQLAKSGNTDAMYVLGNYYFEQKQISNAIEYFFQAAKQGHFLSAQKASALGAVMAKTCEQMGDWETAGTYWAQYRECQIIIIQSEESSEEDCIKAFQSLNQGLYGQGLACYNLKRFDLAIQYLREAAKDSKYVSGNQDAKRLLAQLGGV